jgi:hypothetical protein
MKISSIVSTVAAIGLSLCAANLTPLRAAVIGAWSPDDLTATAVATPITTMPDDSGHGNTLVGGIFPTLYGPATPGYNTVFGSRNYANYAGGGAGLETLGSLYSGGQARTVIAVYDTPTAPSNAGIAGESQNAPSPPGNGSNWFAIESRNNNVTGDPYLVEYGPDVSSNVAPAANRLTFAVATYDGAGTSTLTWAYGLTGSATSHSSSGAINTLATNFIIGENNADGAHDPVQVGVVVVLDSALTALQADAAIAQLQAYYTTPEPSSFVLALIGGAAAVFVYRRRRSA